jgi:hypothetical protein
LTAAPFAGRRPCALYAAPVLRIVGCVMPDPTDPPRKFYKLKPTEFEIVNAPSGSAPVDSTPTNVQAHLRAANAGQPKVKARPATPATPAPPSVPVPRENDVHAMLRDNLARANAAGLNDVPVGPKRRSRRKRDYFLLLIPVNGFFGFMAFGPHANAVSFVYGLAGIVVFSIGLTWVMWFVMDDY